MSAPGGAELLIAARAALLDALDALVEHRDALVLIGAQAVYLVIAQRGVRRPDGP